MGSETQKMYDLIADIKTAMMVTRRPDPRHGTPDDPRLVLIGITVHSAVFFDVDKPKPVVLFELVKGWFTGTEPRVGESHRIDRIA